MIRHLAAHTRGARILNLSFTPFGTAVAELLYSLVPLLRDLGLDVEWQVVPGDGEFGRTARLMYEALNGRQVEWTAEDVDNWRRYGDLNASLFTGSYDAVVVHEPQAIGLLSALVERGRDAEGGRWVWHCHMDLRRALPQVMEALLPALRRFDARVFPHPAFVPPGVEGSSVTVVAPAIDPTSSWNVELPSNTVGDLLARHGLGRDRPLVVQVGSLDGSFDPTGAIDVYRLARAERPDLQLLLIQPTVETSVQAWARFEQVARYAAGDSGVHVLVGQGDVGHLTVNAAQRAASVVVQRSVPAGFAPQLWDAQWKGRPVVAGVSGGLPDQVVDGETGYLASDDQAFVEAILALVGDPARAARMGEAGREVVRRSHLITRFLSDELRLLGRLLSVDTTDRGHPYEAPVGSVHSDLFVVGGGEVAAGHPSGLR